MSATDNYSRLKKWAKDAASGKTSKIPYIDITDLINEVENLRATIAATEAAKAEPTEFKGWYCAHCQRGVDASEVTFHEQHTVCGRVITDDCPPAAKATGTAELTPLPEPFAIIDSRVFPEGAFQGYQMREYGQACAEAARQPAPVVTELSERERDALKLAIVMLAQEGFEESADEIKSILAATNRSQP